MGTYSKRVIEVEAQLAVKGAEEFEKALGKVSKLGKEIISKTVKNSRRDSNLRDKQAGELRNLEARTKTYNKIGKEFNINQAQTDKLLGASGYRIDKTGQVIDKAGNKVRNYTQGLKDNVGVLSKFQVEHLGVMFAGMAMNRMMVGLNATSREWLGIGELTSTMMGITMLGANMDLLEYGVLPLFNALTNLPEGAKKAIGYTVLALEGLGGVMMTGGQLMLGLDSTATLLSKIAGVSPEVIFSEKGLSALNSKLKGSLSTLRKFSRLAGAGIFLAIAVKDLSEDQVVAAVGGLSMSAGIIKGGKAGGALFVAGMALKLVGDEDFFIDVGKFSAKLVTIMLNLGKDLGIILVKSALGLDINIEELKFFQDLGSSMDKIEEQLSIEGVELWGKTAQLMYPIETMRDYNEGMEDIQEQLKDGLITQEDAIRLENDLASEHANALSWLQKYNDELRTRHRLRREEKEEESKPVSRLGFGFGLLGLGLTSKAVGGKVRNTGRYFLHEGEEVIPKTDVGAGQVTVSPTYYVTVSDKREFEAMLRANNDKLTADVRRMSKI